MMSARPSGLRFALPVFCAATLLCACNRGSTPGPGVVEETPPVDTAMNTWSVDPMQRHIDEARARRQRPEDTGDTPPAYPADATWAPGDDYFAPRPLDAERRAAIEPLHGTEEAEWRAALLAALDGPVLHPHIYLEAAELAARRRAFDFAAVAFDYTVRTIDLLAAGTEAALPRDLERVRAAAIIGLGRTDEGLARADQLTEEWGDPCESLPVTRIASAVRNARPIFDYLAERHEAFAACERYSTFLFDAAQAVADQRYAADDYPGGLDVLGAAVGLVSDDEARCGILRMVNDAVQEGEAGAALAWVDAHVDDVRACETFGEVRIAAISGAYTHAEAIPVLADLAEREESVDVLDALAWAQMFNGDSRDAVETYRRLCEIECDARTRGNLVWAQSGFHQQQGVVDEYIAEADANPDNSVRQFETGVMLHYLHRYDESQVYLDRALAVWPTDPRLGLYTAMNAYRAGRFDEGQRLIDAAIERATDIDPDLFYCEAVIYRNVDLERAIDALGRYHTLCGETGPPAKLAMTTAFMRLMREELARRAEGGEPRPFADPEEGFFGTPPGDPGLAPDAIHIPHAEWHAAE